MNEKIKPNNIIPQHPQTMGSVSTGLWTHRIYTCTGSTLIALDTQDHISFTAACAPGRLPVFMYIRRYFGSSLGWSCSVLSALPVGLWVVNPASIMASYVVIRTKFVGRRDHAEICPHMFLRLAEARQHARQWKRQEQTTRRRSRCVYTVHLVHTVPEYTTTLWSI